VHVGRGALTAHERAHVVARLAHGRGNVVRDNVVRGPGRADLALAGPSGGGDCFAGNDIGRTSPLGLETTHACDGLRVPRLNLAATFVAAGHIADGPDIDVVDVVRAQPEPGPQEPLPDGADAPVRPAVDVFAARALDVDAVALPEPPSAPPRERALLLLGVPLTDASAWEVGFGLLGAVVPLVLWLTWVAIALADLAGRADRSGRARAGWAVAVVALPPVGVLTYLLLGRPGLGWGARAALVGGGIGGWMALVVVGAVAAGLV
jgi:hypothetical protein